MPLGLIVTSIGGVAMPLYECSDTVYRTSAAKAKTTSPAAGASESQPSTMAMGLGHSGCRFKLRTVPRYA